MQLGVICKLAEGALDLALYLALDQVGQSPFIVPRNTVKAKCRSYKIKLYFIWKTFH